MSVGLDESVPLRQLLITQRLRQRRGDLGLTQKQVVERLGRYGLRTTNRTLSSLEHGAGLAVAKLPELAKALECTVTYLVGLTDDPHRWEPDQPVDVRSQRAADPPATDAAEPTWRSLILGTDIPERASLLRRLSGDPARTQDRAGPG